MTEEEQAFLALNRGLIIAPAGCGKTQLLADALAQHAERKPVLVLTHTNAGVAALRARLDKLGVKAASYRLYTIDGWALRLISWFPLRAEADIALLSGAKPDYLHIRTRAVELIKSRHIEDVLTANYSRVLVDEYQDCSRYQHAVVAYTSKLLPTIVVGDQMQAIFGFGTDPLADWTKVCSWFANQLELKTPWRWINAGASDLGDWLLLQRAALASGGYVDLSSSPKNVEWIELTDGAADHRRLFDACSVVVPEGGSVLIIGDSRKPANQRKIASQIAGAETVEAVDLRDLVQFATDVDLASTDALEKLLGFAQELMTNVGAADLLERVRVLSLGKARKKPTESEAAALFFLQNRTPAAAAELMVAISKMGGVRSFRPSVLTAFLRALASCSSNPGTTLGDAVIAMREQQRMIGRVLPARAVGSTLLLKGLEADTVVILDADALDARNLYVGMTRGCRRVIICSRSKTLRPSAA